MFFEVFKQHQGEYMGSLLSAFFESMGSGAANDGGDDLDMHDAIDSGLADAVNDNDDQVPAGLPAEQVEPGQGGLGRRCPRRLSRR